MHHRVERRERTIVHVRRRELDISQRRHAELEALSLPGELRRLTKIHRRVRSHAWAQLRHAGTGEALAAKQRSEVTLRTARFAEEEESALLCFSGQCRAVVSEIAI